MITKPDRKKIRQKKHLRIRKNILGTAERPRLAVYRSLNHMYAQLIDDVSGNTLVAASTLGPLKEKENGSNKAAKWVALSGKALKGVKSSL